MIITKLIGGLGNQMFQYAVGRAISSRSGAVLKIDKSDFINYPLRQYQLDKYNIIEEFATKEDINSIVPDQSQFYKYALFDFKQKAYPFHKKPYIKQRTLLFDSAILKIKDHAYIDGYWQNELYFKDISAIIKNEFTLKDCLDKKNIKIRDEIVNSASVSVHIRRGDYVTNPHTRKTHGLLNLDYYYKAIEIINKSIRHPSLYIFSDDIPWVRENLITHLPLNYIYHNCREKDHLDLFLMRLCKHHIIANSSYSWWGAWLSDYCGKIVISPKRWFSNDLMKRIGGFDITPKEWISI